MRQEVLRAFKFALDPTPSQVEAFTRHAGAARWSFNHALGMKVAAHQQWRREVQALVDLGVPEAEARKTVRVPVPTKLVIQKHLNQIKGDSRTGGLPEGVHGPERPCPWWECLINAGSAGHSSRGRRTAAVRHELGRCGGG